MKGQGCGAPCGRGWTVRVGGMTDGMQEWWPKDPLTSNSRTQAKVQALRVRVGWLPAA